MFKINVPLIAVFLFPIVGIKIARQLYITQPIIAIAILPAVIALATIAALMQTIEAYKKDKKYDKTNKNSA